MEEDLTTKVVYQANMRLEEQRNSAGISRLYEVIRNNSEWHGVITTPSEQLAKYAMYRGISSLIFGDEDFSYSPFSRMAGCRSW
jgi:hypothetical protein